MCVQWYLLKDEAWHTCDTKKRLCELLLYKLLNIKCRSKHLVSELVNGMRRSKDRGMSSVGTSEDGEESSSVQDEEEDVHLIMEMLSTVKSPQVK
jgi:hypothetical protein